MELDMQNELMVELQAEVEAGDGVLEWIEDIEDKIKSYSLDYIPENINGSPQNII